MSVSLDSLRREVLRRKYFALFDCATSASRWEKVFDPVRLFV